MLAAVGLFYSVQTTNSSQCTAIKKCDTEILQIDRSVGFSSTVPYFLGILPRSVDIQKRTFCQVKNSYLSKLSYHNICVGKEKSKPSPNPRRRHNSLFAEFIFPLWIVPPRARKKICTGWTTTLRLLRGVRTLIKGRVHVWWVLLRRERNEWRRREPDLRWRIFRYFYFADLSFYRTRICYLPMSFDRLYR
jgi:hypothetical protein